MTSRLLMAAFVGRGNHVLSYIHIQKESRVRGTGPFLVIIHFICICLLSSSFFVDCYCPVVDPVFRFSDGDTVQRLVTMRMAEVRY